MIPSPILFGGCLYSSGASLVEFILKEYKPSCILWKSVFVLKYSVFTTVRALLFYSDKDTEKSYEGRSKDTVRHGRTDIFKTPSLTDTAGASPTIL